MASTAEPSRSTARPCAMCEVQTGGLISKPRASNTCQQVPPGAEAKNVPAWSDSRSPTGKGTPSAGRDSPVRARKRSSRGFPPARVATKTVSLRTTRPARCCSGTDCPSASRPVRMGEKNSSAPSGENTRIWLRSVSVIHRLPRASISQAPGPQIAGPKKPSRRQRLLLGADQRRCSTL